MRIRERADPEVAMLADFLQLEKYEFTNTIINPPLSYKLRLETTRRPPKTPD